jgi:hypothetical protein
MRLSMPLPPDDWSRYGPLPVLDPRAEIVTEV